MDTLSNSKVTRFKGPVNSSVKLQTQVAEGSINPGMRLNAGHKKAGKTPAWRPRIRITGPLSVGSVSLPLTRFLKLCIPVHESNICNCCPGHFLSSLFRPP